MESNIFPTSESDKQIQFLWKNGDLRLHLIKILETTQFRFCADSLKLVIERIGEMTSLRPPCNDSVIYDELHNIFHNKIMQTAEYKRSHGQGDGRSQNRVKNILKMLPAYVVTSTNAKKSLLDIGCSEGSITVALGSALGLSEETIHGCDIRQVVPSSPAPFLELPVTNQSEPILNTSFRTMVTTESPRGTKKRQTVEKGHLSNRRGFKFHLLENPHQLPFNPCSKFIVTTLMTLHHIREPSKVLKEIFRVLEPGGYLIIREHDCPSKETSVVFDVIHGLYAMAWSEPREMQDFRTYSALYRTRKEWEKMIIDSGFRRYLTRNFTSKYYSNYQSKLSQQKVFNRNPLCSYYDVFSKPKTDGLAIHNNISISNKRSLSIVKSNIDTLYQISS